MNHISPRWSSREVLHALQVGQEADGPGAQDQLKWAMIRVYGLRYLHFLPPGNVHRHGVYSSKSSQGQGTTQQSQLRLVKRYRYMH
jgi:hypothetical protein